MCLDFDWTLRVLVVAAVAGLASGVGGCSSAIHRSKPSYSAGASVEASGDWDDVDASVRVAAKAAEVAVVAREEVGEGEIVYTLRTITDEPGRLRVLRSKEGSAAGGLMLSARIGRFGDEAAEEKLLTAVRSRLADLQGVDVAPLRR